ncbi:MAG: hypothetical protein CM15mP77_1710 [Synechococcus sp.]|nr:MAG: hypothetical protein CM15mP77_1710 [Synechococcus sp.]
MPITNRGVDPKKIHRDNAERGYSAEANRGTILRRIPDYINHICPQFGKPTSTSSVSPPGPPKPPFICRNFPNAG